ncbi:hypothetical protein F4782DRAFT_311408 [Xylaria castorea]|nr:hypothetical protein F4782DRAFT_311408 [Xylaria castorea]
MAELARIARPWLFSLRSPMRVPTAVAAASPYLGLGYSRGISATAARQAGKKDSTQRNRETKIFAKKHRMRYEEEQSKAMGLYLLPFTLVTPPIWRFPRSPSKFAQMVWLIAKNNFIRLGSLLSVAFMSIEPRRKGGWFGWPRFRMGKKSCIPAAKALHLQMAEAVAAGDKETLRRICAYELFQTLASAIDSRPRGTRVEWDLVRYDNRLRYPRLADFRVTYSFVGEAGKRVRILKQAVVSISSVQRLARYNDNDDDGGGDAPVPGSERERHMTEHLVLHSVINEDTYEAGPWKIWGTVPEMSLEMIIKDNDMFSGAMEDQGPYGR